MAAHSVEQRLLYEPIILKKASKAKTPVKTRLSTSSTYSNLWPDG